MNLKKRKRSRAAAEVERAHCLFELRVASLPAARTAKDEKLSRSKKPIKKKGISTAAEGAKPLFQPSLFEPTGKFRSNATMDVYYNIEPRNDWTGMTGYYSFVLNSEKYLRGEFVFVANDNCTARGKQGEDLNAQVGPCNVWVAQILEIRALDERHVYARVCWMYSPDELPVGRQPHHGKNEVVASNHRMWAIVATEAVQLTHAVDIINVLSIVRHAKVSQWIEADDGGITDALYWRQAFDYRTSQLSTIDLLCRCQTPANPDKTLVGCTSSDCGQWMHIDCLREDVLKRVHDRLGTDQPYVPAMKMSAIDTYSTIQRQPAQASVNAAMIEDERPSDIDFVKAEINTGILAKYREEGELLSVEQSPPAISQTSGHSEGADRKKTGRPRRSVAKTYPELFQATLRMSDGPMAWEVNDLRPIFASRAQTWSESVLCLLCGADLK